MKLIYVAGKYSGDSYEDIDSNIIKAELASVQLIKNGWAVFTPHLNTRHFEKYTDIKNEVYYQMDIEILTRCDAIFMLDNYADSVGANHEHDVAYKYNLDIYFQEDGYPQCK